MADDKNNSRITEQQSWARHEHEQLDYFRSLSLRQKLQAVQGMADTVRRFQQLRAEGKFSSD